MNADPLTVHRRALVLARRCPACAEHAPPAVLFRGRPCKHCGTALGQLGLYGQDLVAAIESSSRWGFIVVAVLVGVVHLVLGWVPLLDAAVLILATVWIRFAVLHPATEAMSPRRRVITRLTARLWSGTLISVVLVASQFLTLVGVFGLPVKALIGAGAVVGSVFIVRRYVLWQLRREARGVELAGWEYAILLLSAALVLGAIAAVVFTVFTVVSVLTEYLGGVP